MISLIMSIYKENEEQLKQAIESILNQTYKNFEFIIIIDNPEPQKINFVKRYSDKRIKLIINECNKGLVYSLNKGIENANGEYIARMDADDISFPERLENQLKFLESSGCDLCGTFVQNFYKDEEQAIIKGPTKHENVIKILKNHNCIAHPTWLAKREVYEKNNGYRDVFACEDYDFLIRACQNGFKLANVPMVLLKYRLSENSISRKNQGKQELIAEYIGQRYKNNEETKLEDIQKFILSSNFEKKLNRYNKCNNLKIKRARYYSRKFPKYYFYTILLCCNLKYIFKIIKNKIIFKFVLNKEKI